MNTGPNRDQANFWNGEIGRRWLAREAEMEAMNRTATDHIVAEVAATRPARVLEIGCGSGGLALKLAGTAVPRGEVVAADISEPMLARARERAGGCPNLSFLLADAQTADLPGPFDMVVSAFGMMFFDDPVAAFANIRRETAPGGRLLFLTFGAPSENPWFCIPRRIAAARLGEPPGAPDNAPGPQAFADGARVVGLMHKAGWEEPSVQARVFDFHHPGGAVGAAELATSLGPAAFVLRSAGASDSDRAAVKAAVEVAFAPYARPDGLHLPVVLNVFEAYHR